MRTVPSVITTLRNAIRGGRPPPPGTIQPQHVLQIEFAAGVLHQRHVGASELQLAQHHPAGQQVPRVIADLRPRDARHLDTPRITQHQVADVDPA
jgi:hypothetical protein